MSKILFPEKNLISTVLKTEARCESKQEVQLLLVRGGVEMNPGPGRARQVLRKVGGAVKHVAKFVQKIGKEVVPKGTFAKGGTLGGTLIGGPAGGVIGGVLGDQLARVVGFGDYTVQGNSFPFLNVMNRKGLHNNGFIMTKKITGNPMPTFSRRGDGIRITHREFVNDIKGSIEFANTSYLLNPSNEALFPWLSHMAHYFEEYKFTGLIFEYRPTSGMVAAAPELGSVIYATNYNAMEPDFASKREMDSYEYVTSCVPCSGMLHPVECMPGSNPVSVYYTKAVDSPDAQLMYDMGRFQVGRVGMQSSTAIVGELWVSYDVVLSKPRVNVRGVKEFFAHYKSTAADCTAAAPLNAMIPYSDNRIALATTTTTICLPDTGYFLLAISWQGGNTTSAIPTLTAGAHVSLVYGATGEFRAAGSSSSIWAVYHVTVPGDAADNIVTCGGNTGMAASGAYFVVSEVPFTALTRKITDGMGQRSHATEYTPSERDDDNEDFDLVRKVASQRKPLK